MPQPSSIGISGGARTRAEAAVARKLGAAGAAAAPTWGPCTTVSAMSAQDTVYDNLTMHLLSGAPVPLHQP